MDDLISAGIELMLIGMGIVFAFLAMLIVAVNAMTRLLHRFYPEQPIADQTQSAASTHHTDAGVIAAISAAVHQYRNKQK